MKPKRQAGRSLLERVGFNADQRAQLAALLTTGLPVLAQHAADKIAVARLRAETDRDNAASLRRAVEFLSGGKDE